MEIYFQLLNENPLFEISLLIVFFIGTLEILLTVVGIGLSQIFDSIIPESEIGTVSELFSWINKGKVPILILFLTFLTFFGIIGLFIQYISLNILNSQINNYIAIIFAFILSLPIVRIMSAFIAKIMPKDETDIIQRKSFEGKIAIITLGNATKEKAAEAKFKDDFGTTHYILVKPLNEEETFKEGDSVFIAYNDPEDQTIFYIVKDPNKG